MAFVLPIIPVVAHLVCLLAEDYIGAIKDRAFLPTRNGTADWVGGDPGGLFFLAGNAFE